MTYNLEPLIEYIKQIETLVSPARHLPADRAGVTTGGFGETSPSLVHAGMVVSEELATTWLMNRLTNLQGRICNILHFVPTQGQMVALIDFCYNVGISAFTGSTLYRKLLGDDFSGAAEEFKKWDMANGVHLDGLAKRRKLEENWFNS